MMYCAVNFGYDFRAQYIEAFTEALRLGALAAENKIAGLDSSEEEETCNNIYSALKALNSGGLDFKQTEALEYYLRSINATLTVPTVTSVILDFLPSEYRMIAGGSNFVVSGQDVIFTAVLHARYILVADFGAFVLSGQDVNLVAVIHNHYTLTVDFGAFALTGQDVIFAFVQSTLTLQAIFSISVMPTYKFHFVNALETKDITLGDGTIDYDFDETTQKYAPTGSVAVTKLSNGGIAQATGSVQFYKNNVILSGTGGLGSGAGEQNFVAGSNLAANATGPSSVQYAFSGLTKDDVLKASINEGPA